MEPESGRGREDRRLKATWRRTPWNPPGPRFPRAQAGARGSRRARLQRHRRRGRPGGRSVRVQRREHRRVPERPPHPGRGGRDLSAKSAGPSSRTSVARCSSSPPTRRPAGTTASRRRATRSATCSSVRAGPRLVRGEPSSRRPKTHGIESRHAPQPINVFANFRVYSRTAGDSTLDRCVSKPGDAATFRALMDCVVVLSACPQDIVGFQPGGPTDMAVELSD